jgi:hypothetical protein
MVEARPAHTQTQWQVSVSHWITFVPLCSLFVSFAQTTLIFNIMIIVLQVVDWCMELSPTNSLQSVGKSSSMSLAYLGIAADAARWPLNAVSSSTCSSSNSSQCPGYWVLCHKFPWSCETEAWQFIKYFLNYSVSVLETCATLKLLQLENVYMYTCLGR